jgi:hypothetical protein
MINRCIFSEPLAGLYLTRGEAARVICLPVYIWPKTLVFYVRS